MTASNLDYRQFNQQLQTHQIGMNAAELHGFLSGLQSGGVQEGNWKALTYQFTHDGHAYPSELLKKVEELYQHIQDQFSDEEFAFEIFLDEQSVFSRADSLSEWVSHFLLGLALAKPELDKEGEEIREALTDLNDIANLGYDEDDDPEELDGALTEVTEYVRAIAMFFYTEFNLHNPPAKQTIH
ncbi:hypothetical protein A1D23_09045 [Chelonobacter oris]|uniref:UPF0149 family protein n=1 Tax=Chelonobacter oris TaxID=505317 RepID=UPI002448A79B|nr:UPF0149 family protein [Chelonobacter oris]MDH3000325.1 hypothetical protein [Chelonobacter oris]